MSREGIPNVKSLAAKENTKEYFARMLDDAREDLLWKRFLDSTDDEIALRTFLRAVEYKRGKPIQPTESTPAREGFMDVGALPIPADESRNANKPN